MVRPQLRALLLGMGAVVVCSVLQACGDDSPLPIRADGGEPPPAPDASPAPPCAGGTTTCGARCVDLAVDPANCGACGVACEPGLVCASGECALSCTPGLTRCEADAGPPMCAPLDRDPSNCGSCGNACPAGRVCSGGSCVLACVAGYADCDGDPTNGCEVPLHSDPGNCGGCGVTCTGGLSCHAGNCAPPSVLLIASDDEDSLADVKAGLVGEGGIGPIDTFNTTFATPTLAAMKAYDVAVVWAAFLPEAPEALGDRLAEYFDGGGRVVTAAFLFSYYSYLDRAPYLTGRFAHPNRGYAAVTSLDVPASSYGIENVEIPGHPLLSGVSSLRNTWTSNVGLMPWSVQVASGTYPMIVVGERVGRNTVYLNFWPSRAAASWTGDGYRLLRNAILFAN